MKALLHHEIDLGGVEAEKMPLVKIFFDVGQHFPANDNQQMLTPEHLPGRFPQVPGQVFQVKGELEHVAGPQGQGQELLGEAVQLRRHLLGGNNPAGFLAHEVGGALDGDLPGDIEEIFGTQHQAGALTRGGMFEENFSPGHRGPGPGQCVPGARHVHRAPGFAGAPPGAPGGGNG